MFKAAALFGPLFLMLALFVGVTFADPANNDFTSNEFTGTAATNETILDVDVDGTTATSWKLQKKDANGQWVDVTGEASSSPPSGDPFSIELTNDLQTGVTYRLKGTTSGQTGPYDAEVVVGTP